MAKKGGKVTLRGGFAPGTKVELVDGRFVDPASAPVIDSATSSKEGEVSFDGLEPGQEYVVREKDGTRLRRVTGPSDKPIDSVLVPRPSSAPAPEEPQTPQEPTPRVVHEGARGTRQLSSTRGDAFANVGDDEELTKPGHPTDLTDIRQADFAGPQLSDTPIGVATPVVLEEVTVEDRTLPDGDPALYERETLPEDRERKITVARAATEEEVEKLVSKHSPGPRQAEEPKEEPKGKSKDDDGE